jgi:hypothetical protein
MECAHDLEAADPTTPDRLLALAETLALVGEREAAIAAIERAFDAGYEDRYYVLVDPPLAGLADHPAIDRLAPAF